MCLLCLYDKGIYKCIRKEARRREGEREKKEILENRKKGKKNEGEEKKRGASDAEGDTKHLAGRVCTVNGYTGRHHEPLCCALPPPSSNHRAAIRVLVLAFS